jgi:hypothetical protein
MLSLTRLYRRWTLYREIYCADVVMRLVAKSKVEYKTFRDVPVIGSTPEEALETLRSGKSMLSASKEYRKKGYEFHQVTLHNKLGEAQ